ncbi:MAG TPA: Ppx/GppA phosphatase family protein [Polyangia bacterium]|jgi:exopolyphosphatase/guanosine-5'-triphosphate,3'-diphosphate pyrophosphatase
MNLATIDIGTNTTLLLVASAAGETVEVLADRAEITRLGRGIGQQGALAPEAIARTLAALRDYAAIARQHGAPIAAVGTEALRRAANAADFLGPAAEILGGEVEVIDGEREAALTFRAVATSFPDAGKGRLVVVDIGGGSTEIVVSSDGEVEFRVSLPLGSVRLTEAHVHHDPPTAAEHAAIDAAIDAALATVPLPPPPATLVGVAGTVTSLAAMALELPSYDPARVHGYRLSRADLGRQVARLGASTQPERERMTGLDPRRADVIFAGALILDRIATAAGVPEIRVSDRGIRWGLLYERLAQSVP